MIYNKWTIITFPNIRVFIGWMFYLKMPKKKKTHKENENEKNILWKKQKLPLSTWTRTFLLSPFDGSHWYFPESAGRAFCINKFDVVVSSLRVITVIPPRADSYEIIWKRPNKYQREKWIKIDLERPTHTDTTTPIP